MEPDPREITPWMHADARRAFEGTAAFAGSRYDKPIGTVLTAVKDGGRHDLIGFIDEHIEAAWWMLESCQRGCDVVPIPSRRSVVRQRGIDVTGHLATSLARITGGRARSVLSQQRRIADQAGLSARERQRNMRGALVCRPAPRTARPVVLLDDVATTGATLADGFRALTEAHYRVVGIVTAVVTPPPTV